MDGMETTGTGSAALAPSRAAEFAETLFHRPGAHLGRDPVPVLEHRPGAPLRERRASFGGLCAAVTARIGPPTLFGGSAHGPDVRWRDHRRTVLLDSTAYGTRLSVHDTDTLEQREARAFARGPWPDGGPLDFAALPYLWRLDRCGPGESPQERVTGPAADTLEHFAGALHLLLTALVEQLPAQVGGDWAGFCLTSSADRGRRLQISYALGDGLQVSVDDRDGGDGPERGRLMADRGWHFRDRGWWQADFPEPETPDIGEAIRLALRELRARGTREPRELRARDVSCKDRGELVLPGLGIRH
jgi:hypothetical protein